MYLFIVNLQSGNKNTLKNWNEIENLLIERQIPFEKILSNSQVETETFISKHLLNNALNAVAVIGGDGTINSVIQQLAVTTIPLAIFPSGSGNDTARMFQLTDNPKEFVLKMLTGKTTAIDLINVNGRFGITVSGTGLDSVIGNQVNQSFYKPIFNKLGIGSFSYIIAAVITLLTFKPFNGKLTIDGEVLVLTNAWLVACGNTASYGGGLNICPHALPSDGFLNITHLHNANRLNVLFRLFPDLLRGGPVTKEGVFYNAGKEITLETNRPIPAIVDGEITTSTPLHITIRENALLLLLTN
ncbi:diacylglycerol kinase family lipid kinase [Sporosarcina sp. Marseille-Q4063]|uniref:diacylglycerol/lipid kinase family protein n=1 Tax=Sporosarcina sp. Marseille-Q4063 TaxID=2810514 RepID=UPI001BAF4E27|nr:diacylglycerol kinase family protein [Sporosarcina sp. Marseille-Q4063]QUW23665.1 diacylglycerol kinase family lipid kinase [Sporosarcina sp. Marseille-Q4063]